MSTDKIFKNNNEAADYRYYSEGLNVLPYDTHKRIPLISSYIEFQNNPIPVETFEKWKKEGRFSKGMAIIMGKIWRGENKDQYLNGIDCDNKKAIEEICKSLGFKNIDELSNWTIVEQHEDDPNRAHIYVRSTKPFKKKSSDNVNSDLAKKIDLNEIPAIEVKGHGEHGIFFCSPSIHKNGSPYQIIGVREPVLCDEFELHINNICKKYGISYLDSFIDENGNEKKVRNNKNSHLNPIEELFNPNFQILEGHNRHEALLRVMESLLQRNKKILSLKQIKELAYEWNPQHCKPPLDDKEFEKQWNDALKFVGKSINNNTYYNNNRNGNGNIPQRQQSGIIIGRREENYFEYVVKSIKKTVKGEDALIRQILYTGLSTYVEDDPINLGVLAPTSEGKTYPIIESLKYFPDDDVLYIGQMSPKVLVRQKGILIDKKSGQPIGDKIQELRRKVIELVKKRGKLTIKDKDEKENLNDEIDNIGENIRRLIDNSKTLIDLRGKILVFLEPPQHELWNLLKPILSHDKKEIEFPFVDKTANSNAQTKDIVVRGYPACIFCSAKDESKWEIWNEIKSRILVTSPNMIQQKYQDSNKLIAQSKGFPNLIQQQIIISDSEIETTKNYILLVKQKINKLKSSNKNGKISLWIPFADLLQKELPANKGTDVRFVKKIFSLLNIVPIVKSDLRMILMMEGENSIITDLEDLREVLSITQNFDGLPKFKAEFFNDIFYPCFAKKTEPDSKPNDSSNGKNEKKEEEIIAVKTRELCDCFREIRKKPITTDNLKHTYLNQLINEGIIDYTESKINARQNIYYPLVTEPLSIESIMSPIDKDSPQSSNIYEKITRNITEGWIFHEIIHLIRYRLDQGNISFVEYLNDQEKFQIWDNNWVSEEKQHENEKIETTRRTPLTISEFIEKYVDISSKSIDNKPSNILLDFAKRSLFLSILAKIDSIDKKDKKFFKCYHCPSEYQTKKEYTMHCHSNHPLPGPMRPRLSCPRR